MRKPPGPAGTLPPSSGYARTRALQNFMKRLRASARVLTMDQNSCRDRRL